MSKKISSIITQNVQNGAAQAMLYGVGLTKPDLSKYMVGIGSMQFDFNPCNKHLGILQDKCQKSICNNENMVGFKFNTIGVSDGITNGNSGMSYSLPSRELIADSIETMVKAHHHDAMVLIPGCDKNLPASMMAMGRINIPSVLLYGGSILPGTYQNKNVDIVDAFQSYGQYISGDISQENRQELLQSCCHPNGGSCSGMYTCNTMAAIAEVLGLSMPFSSTNPATSFYKAHECYVIDRVLENVLENDIKPKDIVNRDSFLNAIKLTTILGGSTNAVIHLLAMAKEFDVHLSIQDFQDVSDITPILGNLKPHGQYSMVDIHRIQGSMPGIIRYLIENNILDGNTYTITGGTLKENIEKFNIPKLEFEKQKVFYPLNRPFKEEGHIQVLYGNLCPEGSIAKISGKEGNYFRGPARVYDTEDELIEDLESNIIQKGDVLVIRNQGPKGGPGMPEMLKPSSALIGANLSQDVALLTDGRWSGGSSGFIVGHITPEAHNNGPIGKIVNGDMITIDISNNEINLEVSNKILKKRKFKNKNKIAKNSYLTKYQKLVSDASTGCVTLV